jgi:beta-galactosidase
MAVGERVFNVIANGQPLLQNFDVLRTAGADRTAVTQTFTVPVSGGRLTLDFTPLEGDAIVSYISVRNAAVRVANRQGAP